MILFHMKSVCVCRTNRFDLLRMFFVVFVCFCLFVCRHWFQSESKYRRCMLFLTSMAFNYLNFAGNHMNCIPYRFMVLPHTRTLWHSGCFCCRCSPKYHSTQLKWWISLVTAPPPSEKKPLKDEREHTRAERERAKTRSKVPAMSPFIYF